MDSNSPTSSAAPQPVAKTLKARIRGGDLVLGCFVFLPSPAVVEILADAGFDFIIIDQEHSPKNWETVENMIRAAEVRNITALVRVQKDDPYAILQALDFGAGGVVVPFIQSAKAVQAAAAAMYYPPRGVRGLCTQTRGARYGARRTDFVQFAAQRSEELILLGLIEDPEGVASITEILSVEDGLDAILVGRGDLAATMGKLGQTNDPAVREAVLDVISSTVAVDGAQRIRAAMTVFDAAECAAWAEVGCSVFVAASEASLFLNASQKWTADVRMK